MNASVGPVPSDAVVRDGSVGPVAEKLLPEGVQVRIVASRFADEAVRPALVSLVEAKPPQTFIDVDGNPVEMTAEEIDEFEAWERLDAEAMASIDWGEGEIAREEG